MYAHASESMLCFHIAPVVKKYDQKTNHMFYVGPLFCLHIASANDEQRSCFTSVEMKLTAEIG